MEYFNIIAEGITACFGWYDQIKIGGVSLTGVCIIGLFFSLFWRYVLSPLFGSMHSDNVKKQSKKNSSNNNGG